jgi:hypothetical protein
MITESCQQFPLKIVRDHENGPARATKMAVERARGVAVAPIALVRSVEPAGRSIVTADPLQEAVDDSLAGLFRRHHAELVRLAVAFLASDGTGQYLIIDENFGSVNGWVHAGRFHPMTIGRDFVELSCSPAW